MTISFPASPSDGDVYSAGLPAPDYVFNATENVWQVITTLGRGGVTSLNDIIDAGNLPGSPGQFVGFNSGSVPTSFTKATAQTNLSIAKATLTFFFNVVVDGTYTLIQQLPASFTINSMDTSAQSGSFVTSVKLSGTSVTGLNAITVSSPTNANTLATANNLGSAGAAIILIITSSLSATGGVVSLNLTRN